MKFIDFNMKIWIWCFRLARSVCVLPGFDQFDLLHWYRRNEMFRMFDLLDRCNAFGRFKRSNYFDSFDRFDRCYWLDFSNCSKLFLQFNIFHRFCRFDWLICSICLLSRIFFFNLEWSLICYSPILMVSILIKVYSPLLVIIAHYQSNYSPLLE